MNRRFIIMVLLALFLVACGRLSVDVPMATEITLTFSVSSFTDYRLEAVSEAGVGQVGTNDPEITLTVDRRYRIVNKALGEHPFAFSSSPTYSITDLLLTDSGTGSFVTRPGVNFVKNGDGFTFTLTSELAAELKSYICTLHSQMIGAVKVTGL